MSSPPEFNIRWQCSTLSQECQKIIFCSIRINFYSCFSQLCQSFRTRLRKKIIYQVCLEEISPSSTISQLFEVYRPRGTIDLNKRWTFFVAWRKCVSVQKENSWKSISCIKTILPTIFSRPAIIITTMWFQHSFSARAFVVMRRNFHHLVKVE